MNANESDSDRSYLLSETSYGRLRNRRPVLAILPWGATEAHNLHLPHGTDLYQASSFAEEAARRAVARGASPVVLPALPYGNNAQQLDQVATIHISTATAAAILDDVAVSLLSQDIDRLLIVNAHGGNEFRPLVRDLMARRKLLAVVVNFYQLLPEVRAEIFDSPGDHADEMETSLMLHLRPDLVHMEDAGAGESRPFAIRSLKQPGVWTPRPWSLTQPDTGSGDPRRATAEKGRRYFDAISEAITEIVVELCAAKHGDIPYL
ncbi:creatininase family protein [Salinispira pacifica]